MLTQTESRAPFLARVVLGLGLLGVWVWQGLPPAWEAWRGAAQTRPAGALSYDELRATLPEGPLNLLAAAARTACPPELELIAVTDNPIAWLQGNYLLYPRRLYVIQPVDGFTVADLDARTGGCLFTYGPQRARIEPFRARLMPLTCAGEDCLYRVRSTRAG